MPNRLEDYSRFAKKIIEQISKSEDGAQLLKLLREKDNIFRGIEEPLFRLEFAASQLAVGCVAWEMACQENKIEDEQIEKAFLKAVLESFESRESLKLASDFSFYLQRPGFEDEDETVGIAKVFFQRLNLKKMTEKKEGKDAIAPGFEVLVTSLEGFKTSFSNGFEGFVQSLMLP